MRTLEDAWKWYEDTRHLVRLMGRLAKRYWADLPWESRLARDDNFRLLEGPEIEAEATFSLAQLGGPRQARHPAAACRAAGCL